MPGIFISHASADKAFVDHFVDDIIHLGCQVHEDLFYSSGADTGVPSGSDLMAYMRGKVEGAGLVIAIISPTYLTRPVCVAELGAAWGVTNKLFPLLTPGMDRNALEGVVTATATRHIDDEMALDELRDMVAEVTGVPIIAKTWGNYRTKWTASVKRHAKSIKAPDVVTLKQWKAQQQNLDAALQALDAASSREEELKQQLRDLAAVRPQAEVAQVLLPKDARTRFEALLSAAETALGKVTPAVREAVRHDVTQVDAMTWPDNDEDYALFKGTERALADGELREGSEGELYADYDLPDASEARDAVQALDGFLQEPPEDFLEWFKAQYKLPPDLSKRQVWKKLLG